jgi:hypothetical protein
MAGTGRNGGQSQPGHDGDDGSCERKLERYRGRLPVEARLGPELGIYRWHQNIVAPDGARVSWPPSTHRAEPQKRKRPGLCFESRDAR